MTALGEVGPREHLNGVLGLFVQDMGRVLLGRGRRPEYGFPKSFPQLGINRRDEMMRSWNP